MFPYLHHDYGLISETSRRADMDRNIKRICCFALLCAVFASVRGHTYHLGSCATVDPMPDFDMNRFLGKWYGVQKTSTGSKCLIYNFTRTNEPNIFKIEQVSEHPVLGLVHDNNYHYTGTLKADIDSVPARMTVKFPLSVAGSASYVVFLTDYNNFAGVYSCQKLAFANRHSATLLSRTKTLEKTYLDKLRSRLSTFNVNPYDLSIISQVNCESQHPYNINITSDTFSAHNIGNVVRKAGVKIGDGVEYLAKGVSKVYNKLNSGEHDRVASGNLESKDYRAPDNTHYNHNDMVEILPENFQSQLNKDAEWLR